LAPGKCSDLGGKALAGKARSQEGERKQEIRIGQNEDMAKIPGITCPIPHVPAYCFFASVKLFLFLFPASSIILTVNLLCP
jgi:hypothetical protein